jgi:hypothetical protein
MPGGRGGGFPHGWTRMHTDGLLVGTTLAMHAGAGGIKIKITIKITIMTRYPIRAIRAIRGQMSSQRIARSTCGHPSVCIRDIRGQILPPFSAGSAALREISSERSIARRGAESAETRMTKTGRAAGYPGTLAAEKGGDAPPPARSDRRPRRGRRGSSEAHSETCRHRRGQESGVKPPHSKWPPTLNTCEPVEGFIRGGSSLRRAARIRRAGWRSGGT